MDIIPIILISLVTSIITRKMVNFLDSLNKCKKCQNYKNGDDEKYV